MSENSICRHHDSNKRSTSHNNISFWVIGPAKREYRVHAVVYAVRGNPVKCLGKQMNFKCTFVSKLRRHAGVSGQQVSGVSNGKEQKVHKIRLQKETGQSRVTGSMRIGVRWRHFQIVTRIIFGIWFLLHRVYHLACLDQLSEASN